MSDLSIYNFDFEENTKWQRVLDLTHAVWKVVDLSVESNILKNKIKDLTSEILTKYTGYVSEKNIDGGAMTKSIDELVALLSLAQKTSNLREVNFLILKNEYKKIKFYILSDLQINELNSEKKEDESELKRRDNKEWSLGDSPVDFEKDNNNNDIDKKSSHEESLKTSLSDDKKNKLSDRQEIIMNFFKDKKDEKIKLRDVKKFFPKYTDRTIRNDLKGMCDLKLILRSDGRGQGSFYYLNRKSNRIIGK